MDNRGYKERCQHSKNYIGLFSTKFCFRNILTPPEDIVINQVLITAKVYRSSPLSKIGGKVVSTSAPYKRYVNGLSKAQNKKKLSPLP